MASGKQWISANQAANLALLFEGGLVGIALGLGWLLDTPAFALFQLSGAGVIQGVLATLPLLLLVLCAAALDFRPVERLFRLSQERISRLFRGTPLLTLALVAGIAGLGEEALFRGVIQTLLATHLNALSGVLIAAVLFGLVHSLSLAYAISATLIGIYLGWLLLCFDNLLVPIMTHSLYDFIVLVVLVKRDNDAPC
ncbi:CPBP family intramembrane glutamic endopeptidase [Amphritea pacifica]|uniref:CPBP family intramembrane metalloprotease n=1 Tax=Amphritea pacifica TaxID=2811233 RepID=A0ABS2WC91_9GAMM|nr:CPBP family intramembrane glutamic endopeptidase [Amphritea pacifica]MBN0989329.1 CPBP family intramembrane metalloprotease [Amphritea pacifica]MBN1009119.1 CPBP family intramembrane metalloprotease [Amphritea pacifica]